MMIRVQSASFAQWEKFFLCFHIKSISLALLYSHLFEASLPLLKSRHYCIWIIRLESGQETGNIRRGNRPVVRLKPVCSLHVRGGGIVDWWRGVGVTGGLDIDHHLDQSHHTSAAYQRIVIWDNIEQFTKRINYDHFVAPINTISPSYLCSIKWMFWKTSI